MCLEIVVSVLNSIPQPTIPNQQPSQHAYKSRLRPSTRTRCSFKGAGRPKSRLLSNMLTGNHPKLLGVWPWEIHTSLDWSSPTTGPRHAQLAQVTGILFAGMELDHLQLQGSHFWRTAWRGPKRKNQSTGIFHCEAIACAHGGCSKIDGYLPFHLCFKGGQLPHLQPTKLASRARKLEGTCPSKSKRSRLNFSAFDTWKGHENCYFMMKI